MAEATPRRDLQELSDVRDPDVRRALRAMHRSLIETVERHQLEIEAMVQIMLEKRVMSMSEYRLHLSRLQQGRSQRDERIHEELSSVGRNAPSVEERTERTDDENGGRYRLDG